MKIKTLLGTPGLKKNEENCSTLCLPSCYLGLEYEWENTQNLIVSTAIEKYFIIHNDGSLRNNGRELVFNKPLSGQDVLDAIQVMDDAAHKYNFKASYRTSLHCHLDMLEMDFPNDIHLLAILYCLFEPTLYKFIGGGRDACNYCVPWYAHPQHYQIFIASASGQKDPKLISHTIRAAKQYKYSGLNFFSIGDFGTIEWRQAPVDMPKGKIVQWLNLIMRHKKYILDHPDALPDWLLTYAQRRGVYEMMEEVFGEDAPNLMKHSTNLQKDFNTGVATATHYLTTMKRQ